MGLRRRKLLSKDDDDELKEFCKDKCSSYLSDAACPSDCHSKCLNPCTGFLISIPLPDHPDPPSKSSHRKLPTLVTSTIALLSFTFLFVMCYVIYAKFYAGRRGRRRRTQPDPPPAVTQEEFLDEEQGPVVDHPIWYIRTVGLQPSVINAITVCKFKSGDGLIDGTECSVCLSEFEEDEMLRLLPKCSHAFHLPCIDTWLRSHTNCPMCRAPILIQPAAMAAPSLESSTGSGSGSGQPEETTQMETLQNPSESRQDQEEEDDGGLESISVEDELRCPDEDSNEGLSDIQPMRRSVSLDSLSALGISSALAVLHLQPQEKADAEGELGERKENNNNPKKSQLRGHHRRPAAINRSVSWSGKFLLRSSTQRSLNGVDDHS